LQRTFVPLSAALFASLAIGAWAGGPSPQTSTAKKKAVAKTATKAKTAPKTSTTAAATKRTATSKSKRPAVARHYAPQQPSQERYKEIQQALASKGYFRTEPDGAWGPASIDALRRFQHDQNLVEDGKIGSLSLIALGLGPKREPPEPVKTVEPEQKIP
jgi:peptidoglycan hydrolase-like protein with peptidoglycan-binding domain